MSGLGDHCAICRKDLGYTIPRCQFCQKSACNECATRTGGHVFCNRACSYNFFFGGADDAEESDSGEEE